MSEFRNNSLNPYNFNQHLINASFQTVQIMQPHWKVISKIILNFLFTWSDSMILKLQIGGKIRGHLNTAKTCFILNRVIPDIYFC